jgi:hypothetical protein
MRFHAPLTPLRLVGKPIFVGEQYVPNVIWHSHRHVFARNHLTTSQGAHQYPARNERGRVPSVSCACEPFLANRYAMIWRSRAVMCGM